MTACRLAVVQQLRRGFQRIGPGEHWTPKQPVREPLNRGSAPIFEYKLMSLNQSDIEYRNSELSRLLGAGNVPYFGHTNLIRY